MQASNVSGWQKKKKCQDLSNSQKYFHWYEKFDECSRDEVSKEEMSGYCGNTEISTIPYIAKLKTFDENSNMKNIYCRFEFYPSEKKEINVNFTKHVQEENSNLKMTIEYLYEDLSSASFDLNTNSYHLSKTKFRKITFHFFSTEYYSANPFDLTVEYSNEKKTFDTVILIIIAISIVCLMVLISLLIFQCFKATKEKEQRLQRMNEIIDNHFNARNGINPEDDKKKEQIEKNKKLLSEILKEIPFQQDHASIYGDLCTICFDKFNEGDKVISLNCDHMFHSNCIHIWIEKSILLPKCPNCNYDIIKGGKVERKEHLILSSNTRLARVNVNENSAGNRETAVNVDSEANMIIPVSKASPKPQKEQKEQKEKNPQDSEAEDKKSENTQEQEESVKNENATENENPVPNNTEN